MQLLRDLVAAKQLWIGWDSMNEWTREVEGVTLKNVYKFRIMHRQISKGAINNFLK